MRRSLIMFLLMFALLHSAQSQATRYQPCASGALQGLLNTRADYAALAERIEAASTIDELLTLSVDTSRYGRLVEFMARFCHEGYDMMWRLDHWLSDILAGQTLQLVGVEPAHNPFLPAARISRNSAEEQAARIETLIASGERDDDEGDSSMGSPDCFHEDFTRPTDRVVEHQALMRLLPEANDIDAILRLSRQLIDWRGRTWREMSGCLVAYSELLTRGRLLSDLLAISALRLAGVADADNPLVEATENLRHPQHGYLGYLFLEERLRAQKRPVAPVTAFGIADCTPTQISAFARLPVEFDSLIADAQSVDTGDEQLNFIQRQVEWRRSIWLQLPMCRQVLELGWLMLIVSSDFAADFALTLLAGAELDRPNGAAVDPAGENLTRLNQARDAFAAYATGEARPPESADDALFTCAGAFEGASVYDAFAGYSDVMRLASTIEDLDDARRANAAQIAWRAEMLERLPACPELIEFAWLTLLLSTGESQQAVLDLAGVADAGNPYPRELAAVQSRMRAVDLALLRGQPLAKEMGPPGRGQLPQCAASESLAIAVPAVTYFDALEYPRALTLEEMVDYAAASVEWRDSSFRAYPLCAEAHTIRLRFTQLVADTIARRALDIDGRLYSSNPWRQLADDEERFDALTDELYASRVADGPPPDERVIAACAAEDVAAVAHLAEGIASLAQALDTLDLQADLRAYHQRILDWRADLMARLPQCEGAIQAGWLMNDISIDLAVSTSLTFAGAAADALPHTALIAEHLARLSQLAGELGIDLPADATP